MNKNTAQATCKTCLYFVLRVSGTGDCHRHAPRRTHGVGSGSDEKLWPTLNKEDGCGEHEPLSEGLVAITMLEDALEAYRCATNEMDRDTEIRKTQEIIRSLFNERNIY